MNLGRLSVNFARSCTLFVLIGILAAFLGGGANVIGLAAFFSIGLGVLLGILALFGVGRPANEPYKAPWITLSLGCMWLLFVGIGAISAAARATAPFIDQVNGFRLDRPGNGWKILSKEELRPFNKDAVAGAERRPNLAGRVFVETPDPDFRIVGREREVGKLIIHQSEVA